MYGIENQLINFDELEKSISNSSIKTYKFRSEFISKKSKTKNYNKCDNKEILENILKELKNYFDNLPHKRFHVTLRDSDGKFVEITVNPITTTA